MSDEGSGLDDEPVVKAVDLVFTKLQVTGFNSLNDAQRALLCIWSASSEIDNGGFGQFFASSSGDWSAETAHAFKQLQTMQPAIILRDAMSVFPAGNPSPNLKIRRGQMQAFSTSEYDYLSLQDEKFYDSEAEMESLIEAFVRDHGEALFES